MDERLDFSQTWPKMLQEVTTYTYGWSFVVAWLGMFSTLLASGLFGLSFVYFWVPIDPAEDTKATAAQRDKHNCSYNNNCSDNNNSSESGNSAETTIADSTALDLLESNQFYP